MIVNSDDIISLFEVFNKYFSIKFDKGSNTLIKEELTLIISEIVEVMHLTIFK